MARFTPTHRRLKNKMCGEHARSGFLDGLEAVDLYPRGGGGGGGGGDPQPWQRPQRIELRGVLVGGQIHQRLCVIIPSRAP